MIVDRYVSWKLKRNPDAFMQLHADLISARMGITLNRFLQICLISALVTGFSAGIAAALFASLIYIPRVSIQIYNVFNLQLPSYYIPQLNQTNFAILAFFVIFVLLSPCLLE